MNIIFNWFLFSYFTLFSTIIYQLIFPFASRGKVLRPLLALYNGAVALVFFEIDFEVVADAVVVDSRYKAANNIFRFIIKEDISDSQM